MKKQVTKNYVNYLRTSVRPNIKVTSKYDPKKDRQNVAFHKSRKLAMEQLSKPDQSSTVTEAGNENESEIVNAMETNQQIKESIG